jgi:hypothetical protein
MREDRAVVFDEHVPHACQINNRLPETMQAGQRAFQVGAILVHLHFEYQTSQSRACLLLLTQFPVVDWHEPAVNLIEWLICCRHILLKAGESLTQVHQADSRVRLYGACPVLVE